MAINLNKYFEKLKTVRNENFITPNHLGTQNIDITSKFILKTSETPRALAGIASSKMYKHIGISTPEISQIKSYEHFNYNITNTIQPNVTQIPDIKVVLSNDNIDYIKISYKFWGNYKWEIFYNNDLKLQLLNIITEQCLTQLQNIFLIDELRTDCDRHTKNYFLYKSKTSKKYDGIIVIDLEQMVIYDYCDSSKDSFNNFLYVSYPSATPQNTEDFANYIQRINNLRELIQDGVLSNNNLQALKDALNYDLPKQTKLECKERKLHNKKLSKSTIDPISRLWKYNSSTIGKDLGL